MAASLAPFFIGTRRKQRFSILTYHRVFAERDAMRNLEPDVKEFTWQMELLSAYFNPMSLADALVAQQYGDLPERAVCVTFDDGYANNFDIAYPVLEACAIPATIFVTTGFLNGGMMWNDQVAEVVRVYQHDVLDLTAIGLRTFDLVVESRRMSAAKIVNEIKHWPQPKRESAVEYMVSLLEGSLPSTVMMTDEQLVELSDKGVDIGAHTVSHPILSTLSLDEAKSEILESKEYLENLLGKPVRHFAYPNGRPNLDYLIEHRDLVEVGGFDAAVSTKWGAVTKATDRWQLPRFTPWDKTPDRFMMRLLLNYKNVDTQHDASHMPKW